MTRISMLGLLGLFSTYAPSLVASELKLFPSDIVLTGPHASQRLIAVRVGDGHIDADLTRQSEFVSSNPKVAAVDMGGTIRAVGDGEATILARSGDLKASVLVKVAKTAEPFSWSFQNHVLPVLTKIGCNSGACHG